jgi:alpha-ketoglutaric semialdehyde dehydrogenase
MNQPITGTQLIGFESKYSSTEKFQSNNPSTGSTLPYSFYKATQEDVNEACALATAAFQVYRKKSGVEKAVFLEAIAEEILAIGDTLIDICCEETALPRPRIEGERGRTMNQLRMFANLLREGSWVDARIETADAQRAPLPKPDLRYMLFGIGPVVVFGASNFPLAFSVAGGDTASALAAGCPVIVKAHGAHPATSELVGKAIQRAAQRCNMPNGVFSLLHGDGRVIGTQLVKNSHVKAVGLTGSFTAGKALFDIAAQRDEPIPVYAEMGSTNPVFVLPEAMAKHGETIATNFAASVTLGVGQFCTNPGLLLYPSHPTASTFVHQVKDAFEKTSGGTMLSETIYKSYLQGIAKHAALDNVEAYAKGAQASSPNYANPILFKTGSAAFQQHHTLAEEIFGPTSTLVEMSSKEDILAVARNLSGHLTATVHGTEADLINHAELLDILTQKVGRIVINGFPTGVEVCSAMVHGGPFPATTDGRSTSVGTAAIFRFTRAVSFQNLPDTLLPPELKDQNPLGVWRLVNGDKTKEPVTRKS